MAFLNKTVEKIILHGGNIIVASNNSDSYVYAKSELEYHLSKLFNVVFSNCEKSCSNNIYLGKSSDFGFVLKHTKPEGFDIIISSGNLYIISDTDRGIIYAVYDCLEKLGVRFLTNEYTYFPKKARGKTGNYYSDPDFDIRMFLTASVMANGFAVKKKMCSENIIIDKRKGGTLEWNQTYGCNHTTLNYVPTSVYFTEENKEQNKHMYQLDGNGKPIDICMTDGITDDGEMDKSMPVSAFKVALKNLINAIEKDKTSKYFPFGQMDTLSSCQCERCQKAEKLYKRSGMNIRFANLLLKHVRQYLETKGEKRDIYLVLFAYNYSTIAPTALDKEGNVVPLVKADDNICVRIAPIGENCYFPIESDMHFLPYKRIIEEWHLVVKNIMMWDYHTNYKRYLWYFPTIQHWKKDLKFFRSSGVNYMFMQSNHTEKVDWKADMELYSAAKCLWNINTNPVKTRNEYIDLYFGTVAKDVKKIIKIFDRNYKNMANRSVKIRAKFWRDLFGNLPRIPSNLSTEEICKNLRKEAEIEWTKNVYFNVYHKEISFVKEQPLNYLEKQMTILSNAKNKISDSDYSVLEKERIIIGLEKIELTLRYMILYNYDEYYKDDKNGREIFAKEFYSLCEKLHFVDFGEGIKIEKIKENIGYNW